MTDSTPATWRRNIGALILVAAMVLSGIPAIKVTGVGTGTEPFLPIDSAPAYTFSDFAWADNGTTGLAVGNTSGDGRVYRYTPRNDAWTPVITSAVDGYNGVDYLPAFSYAEGFEAGTTGWTFKNWMGTLAWHRVIPTTLPTPGSYSHAPAHGGSYDLWFGKDATGNYDDSGAIVRGSAVSPKMLLSNAFSSFSLDFWHWYETESGTSFDRRQLYIKDTMSSTWVLLQDWTTGYAPYSKASIDLTPWMGKTIQLNFTFDSGGDGSVNNMCGWHVDDISVTSNSGVFVYVGTTSTGSTVYTTDGYSGVMSMGLTTSFRDVACGVRGKFMAVGSMGAARYFNGTAWTAITGALATDTLTAIDHNGTHYFVVGFTMAGAGVSYYIADDELAAGRTTFHTIPDAPTAKLWGVDWSNNAISESGTGAAAAAATGNVYGFGNPELWKPIGTVSVPDARYRHAMCFDDSSDTLVLFGGNVNGVYSSDTWEYSRSSGTWGLITPTGSTPPARHSAGMVYDTSLQACVLFGGTQVSGYRSDTWLYYSRNNTWLNVTTGVYPTARSQHSMAYDPSYQRVVMFGGYDGYGYRTDTWVWLSGTKSWSNVTSGLTPTKRGGAAMTWDTAHGRAILFGGSNGTSNAQTWAFDTGSNTWTLRGTGPITPRGYAAMAYDPLNDIHVLFGGSYAGYLKDTWTYNYNANLWTPVDTHATPPERYASPMAYDSESGRFLVFGGWNAGGFLNDMWQFSLRSPWFGTAEGTKHETFYDVEYGPDGQEALMVGHNTSTSTAVIYKWSSAGGQGGISKLIRPLDAELDDHILYGVAYNPKDAAGSAIAVGASAFAIWPSNIQASTVTVDVIYSHIAYLDIYDQGTMASRLNSQVDVDPGTGTVAYDLVVRAWNVLGQSQITQVDAYMWYSGAAGAGTEPSPFEVAGYENQRIHLRWVRGSPDTWARVYPMVGSDDETTLIVGSCARVDDVDGLNVTLSFRFSPHQQVRAANSNFAWNQPSGTRYGGGVIEGQSNPAALDDDFCWNIRVAATDGGGNEANAYDNYGYFKYTYVGTAGLPGGGNVYGSGPPSTSIVLSPSDQDVTFCSNEYYRLMVTVTNLTGQSTGQRILRTSLSLQGGNLAVSPFDIVGTPLYMFGSAVGVMGPRPDKRTTTTSTGDGLPDLDPVIWRCNIPSVPEDRYMGTAVYSVVHS
ncbi:MAG: kelch repeat-containing protein [Methanobacteriota archaeon]